MVEYARPIRSINPERRIAALFLFFLLSFSSLRFIPGLFYTSEIWFVLVFLYLVMSYLPEKLNVGFKNCTFENYGISLLIYVPLVGPIMANSEFGQPWIYGFLAQREIVLVGCMLMFLHSYRKQWFSLIDVERALLLLAWVTLVLFTLAKIIFVPDHFNAYIPTFVTGGVGTDNQFKFEINFIIFGFYYYAFSAYRENSAKFLFLSLPFFIYMVHGPGSRLRIFVSIICYLFLIVRWGNVKKTLIFIPKMVLLITLLLPVFFIVHKGNNSSVITRNNSSVITRNNSSVITRNNSSVITRNNSSVITRIGDSDGVLAYVSSIPAIQKIIAAFKVVTTGKEGSDPSANARISESKIALPYVRRHWVLGNGTISNKWKGGYKSLLGYFYPSDIGLLGVLYLYGVLGLLIFAYQFRFALRYSKLLSNIRGRYINLTSAVKGFLLFYAVSSLVTGQFVGSVEQGLIMIAILYCAAQAEGHGLRGC